MQELIGDRSSFSVDCEADAKALGFSARQIAETAAGLYVQDGTTSKLPVSALYGSATAAGRAFQAQEDKLYGPGQTIANEFARNLGGLTADTVLFGNTVFVNPSSSAETFCKTRRYCSMSLSMPLVWLTLRFRERCSVPRELIPRTRRT